MIVIKEVLFLLPVDLVSEKLVQVDSPVVGRGHDQLFGASMPSVADTSIVTESGILPAQDVSI